MALGSDVGTMCFGTVVACNSVDVSSDVHESVHASVLVLVLVVRGSAVAVCSVEEVEGPYVPVPVLVPSALSRVRVPVVVVVGVVAPGSVVCPSVVVAVLVLVFCSVFVSVFLSIVVPVVVFVALPPRHVSDVAASFVSCYPGYVVFGLPVASVR